MDEKKNQRYQQLVREKLPDSPLLADCAKAFITGGAICALGEGVSKLGESLFKLEGDAVSAFTAAVMVALGALLTGAGVYDKIAGFGGAGAAVPITGFSNGIVASAMEFRSEGLVMGMGAKMFTIAGPVLLYGVLTSTLAAAVYMLLGLV